MNLKQKIWKILNKIKGYFYKSLFLGFAKDVEKLYFFLSNLQARLQANVFGKEWNGNRT